jgi:hypothetical protein
MDYSVFIDQTLTKYNIPFHAEFSAYSMQWHPNRGWPVKMPDIEPGKFLVLHLPDYVTWKGRRILELEQIEQRYGDDAHRVIVHYWNHGLSKYYTGPVNIMEFSSHNHGTANSLRDIYPEWKHILNPGRKQWQCLNGRYCQHRRRAVDVLQHWSNGILSYGTEIPLPNWNYDHYIGCNNQENFLRLSWVYGAAQINIVTETMYDDAPGIVTEKTQMAFAAEQVPIVIGHRGIVQDCRELGFDMFDDLVDNSYDMLPNDVRVEEALRRNQGLILGQIDLEPYRARLQRNRLFLLDEFPERCRHKYERSVAALAMLLGTI